MGILPIILFFLGVVFLFLGWRWQGFSKDQDKTILKGLALLRREIINIQKQVNFLEGELQRIKLAEQTEKIEQRIKKEPREEKFKESNEVCFNPLEINRMELQKSIPKKLVALNDQEQEENSCGEELSPYISSKYQQVLELAARGQRVPEIAQNLSLSQDAVQMVLTTHPKGVIR